MLNFKTARFSNVHEVRHYECHRILPLLAKQDMKKFTFNLHTNQSNEISNE